MTMNLARHVLAGYQLHEPPLVRLLENAVLHFAPITEGYINIVQQFAMKLVPVYLKYSIIITINNNIYIIFFLI